jgi:hypothetical protein
MSYSSLINCENLQTSLEQSWSDPREWGGMARSHPFAEWITAPENRRAIVDQVSPAGTGKLRTVTVKGWQSICTDAVLENQPNPNCAAEGSLNQFYQNYTIDTTQNLQVQINVTVDQFALACEGNGEILQEHLRRMVDALDAKVAELIATQSVALAGGWSAAVTDVTGDVLDITTATPRDYFAEITALRNAADESGYPQESAVFGGAVARVLFQALNAGCCANTGVDLFEAMRLYGYGFAYDRDLNAAMSANENAMIVAPGALQLLAISLAPNLSAFGQTVMDASNFVWNTMFSPRFGVPYDLTVSSNCGNISIALTFTGRMISMPDDILCATDDLAGVNYAGKILFGA